MIRALAVVGVGLSAAYVVAHNGSVGGIDLMSVPLALVVFSFFCCGLVLTLRAL